VASSAELRTARPGRLRVVTLNLGFHLAWEGRRSEIARELDELDVDVVLLQEVVSQGTRSWADDLTNDLRSVSDR
jgi:endonuclease/exonuclease/phosphatase family metal-dependent hydrolase